MPESVASSFLSRMGSRSSVSGREREYKATVQLLDDNETLSVDFRRGDTGQAVFDHVCHCLNIVEKDYFGLRYMDNFKNRYWLDPAKPIFRQIKGMFEGVSGIVLRFRVRFYPREPWLVREELTRYQLFLQLRRDLLHGRLYAPQADAAYLGAAIVQSELGDYNAAEHVHGYVSEYKLFLKQTQKLEERIAAAHPGMKGLTPAGAESAFLKRAATLDTYGYDPYTVKDGKGGQLYLGVTHLGVLVFQSNRKIHHIKWADLDKVDYLGKELIISPKASYRPVAPTSVNQSLNASSGDASLTATNHNQSQVSAKSHRSTKGETGPTGPLRYTCSSGSFCKHLWKYTLSQQAFFTKSSRAEVAETRSKARIPLLARGSTFRFSGRVLAEIKEGEEAATAREEPPFIRYHLERQPSRADRGFPWMSKYSTLPRLRPKPSGEEDLPARAHEAPANAAAAARPDSPEDPRLTLDGGSPLCQQDFSPRGAEAGKTFADPAAQDFLTSTPKSKAPPAETELRERKAAPRKLVETTASPASSSASDKKPQEPPGVCRRLVGGVLKALLVSMLVVGLVVAAMEAVDASAEARRTAARLPGFLGFRDELYRPAKASALAAYQRLLPSQR